MWKVVYIAQTKENAQKGGQGGAYEISVPYSEAEDAYEVLCENRFRA